MDKGLIVHVLIKNETGEVLLLRRSKGEYTFPGFWDIPGGTLEDGEDPLVGVIRETKEETGLEVTNLRLFHYTSNVDEAKDKQFVRLIFMGGCDSSDVRLNLLEHDEYRWILPQNISSDMSLVEYLPQTFRRCENVFFCSV